MEKKNDTSTYEGGQQKSNLDLTIKSRHVEKKSLGSDPKTLKNEYI